MFSDVLCFFLTFSFVLERVESNLLHKYHSKNDILILTVRLAVIVAVILTVPVLFFTVSKRPQCNLRKANVSPFLLPSGACSRESLLQVAFLHHGNCTRERSQDSIKTLQKKGGISEIGWPLME